MLYRRNRIIVGEGLNCVTRPAAWHVEPLVSSSFSSSTTSGHPAFARWYATLAPVMPPPTTTARARSMALEPYSGSGCCLRVGGTSGSPYVGPLNGARRAAPVTERSARRIRAPNPLRKGWADSIRLDVEAKSGGLRVECGGRGKPGRSSIVLFGLRRL